MSNQFIQGLYPGNVNPVQTSFYLRKNLMLRIGVLSDTHFLSPEDGSVFLEKLLQREFKDVDLILHAGDVVHPDSLIAFEEIPLYLVQGNMDPSQAGVPIRRIVEAGGFRIGLIHGWGAALGLEERVMAEFADEDLDCLVYGHSHHWVNHHQNGLLLFNPGSPTDRRGAPFHSVGILELDEDIRGHILSVD